ncbi:MAG: DUF1801 domain-containing protein [Saprospiraceae bacterium]|nr:DUF1801 domain-containing protein [Saprospiraceae bacterium]
MPSIEDYIYRYEGKQREILQQLHHLLTEELNLEAKLRYKIPFYYNRSWVCYLNAPKEGGVELAFTRGNELSNDQGLLDDKGRKQVMSMLIEQLEQIHDPMLLEVWQEAILLDETIPYASKRQKKK